MGISSTSVNSRRTLRAWMRSKRPKWRQGVQVPVTELCELVRVRHHLPEGQTWQEREGQSGK